MIPKKCGSKCNITVYSGKFHPKKHYDQLFFQQKQNFVRNPKMEVFLFWDQTCDPFRESKIFFSQNLTYSYIFLGWNLPGIKMAFNSLHNYFGVTVKSAKTMKNSVFSDFDCDPEIMMKWLQHDGNLQKISPQKTQWSTFFSTKKKKFRPTSQNGRLPILRPNLWPLSGIYNSFFLKI